MKCSRGGVEGWSLRQSRFGDRHHAPRKLLRGLVTDRLAAVEEAEHIQVEAYRWPPRGEELCAAHGGAARG